MRHQPYLGEQQQIPSLRHGRVAQSVEQGIENPRVGGSIPSSATIKILIFPGLSPDPQGFRAAFWRPESRSGARTGHFRSLRFSSRRGLGRECSYAAQVQGFLGAHTLPPREGLDGRRSEAKIHRPRKDRYPAQVGIRGLYDKAPSLLEAKERRSAVDDEGIGQANRP